MFLCSVKSVAYVATSIFTFVVIAFAVVVAAFLLLMLHTTNFALGSFAPMVVVRQLMHAISLTDAPSQATPAAVSASYPSAFSTSNSGSSTCSPKVCLHNCRRGRSLMAAVRVDVRVPGDKV